MRFRSVSGYESRVDAVGDDSEILCVAMAAQLIGNEFCGTMNVIGKAVKAVEKIFIDIRIDWFAFL